MNIYTSTPMMANTALPAQLVEARVLHLGFAHRSEVSYLRAGAFKRDIKIIVITSGFPEIILSLLTLVIVPRDDVAHHRG